MRYALAAAVLLAAASASAREAPPTRGRAISNDDVRAVCVQITGRDAGHSLRDCMSYLDLWLTKFDIPRAEP